MTRGVGIIDLTDGDQAISVENIKTSCSIPLAGREAPQHSRIEGEIGMSIWEKTSEAEAPRKKITFLAPTPFRGFLGVSGSALRLASGYTEASGIDFEKRNSRLHKQRPGRLLGRVAQNYFDLISNNESRFDKTKHY